MKRSTRWGCAAVVMGGAAVAASSGQTVTVTTAADVSDAAAPQTVAQLPGPDGVVSFREAVAAANNTPGPQTIAFAVPPGRWNDPFFPGRVMLDFQGPVSLTGDDTTIDFTTQAAAFGDTNPGGNEVGMQYYGPPSNISFLFVNGHRNVIRGLDVTTGNAFGAAINISGGGNVVEGCTSTTVEIEGYFGGAAATGNTIRNNRLYSVEILCNADGNVVSGNVLTHVRIEGSRYCVYPTGNRLGGPTAAERNVISGYGYYGEEGFPVGSQVDVSWARDTVIENNYVGTTEDGMSRKPQIGPGGITVRDAINTTIRGNLIAGLRTVGANHYAGQIFGDAIVVTAINSDSQGTTIVGNSIGLAADGVTPIVTRRGILVNPSTARQRDHGVRIGGAGAGEGNTIAGVETRGILVGSLDTGVRISGNAVYDCGVFPIDLAPSTGADGPTANDAGDADAGGNGLQNFPVIAAAEAGGGSVRVRGELMSAAGQAFVVEFFASGVCPDSGRGEARRFLGAAEVVTAASGVGAFDLTLAGAAAAAGEFVAATARHAATGDTSEIGPCAAVTAGACRGDFNADGSVTVQDVFDFLGAYFAQDARADVNGADGVGVQDVFDYLGAYFAGC